jgi:hypothetical protein
MGGGKGKSSPPPQIDPGKSMGEFYFGKGFSNYQGVTDPRLQELFLGAEATYRPEYTALELADIGVMARGLGEREVADPRYTQAQDRISGLQAELAKTPDTISETRKTGLHGRNRSRTETVSVPNPKRAELEREIASQQELIAGLSPTKMQSATPGLFDLLEEQSRRAGVLQREELQLQRESDVGALREFAPQVVEAYRAADPYSTELADIASRRAQEDLGLSAKGQALLDDPAFAEQEALLKQRGMEFAASTGQLSPLEQRGVAQQARAASVARGLGQEAGLRAQRMGLGAGLIGQEASIGSQRLGQAFGMQRQMAGDIGSVLLGRPSAAIGLGGQMLGQAQAGAAGPMGPQLFDPNVGINMALQQRGQDVTFQGMQAQAKAAGQAGFMGAIGAIGGGFLGRG